MTCFRRVLLQATEPHLAGTAETPASGDARTPLYKRWCHGKIGRSGTWRARKGADCEERWKRTDWSQGRGRLPRAGNGAIAKFRALRLYDDYIAQTKPGYSKTLTLQGVEYCRWKRNRSTGVAALGTLAGGAAVGIQMATFGDGHAYWIPVWIALAVVSIILFCAYFRVASGEMTIRGRFGTMVEKCGDRLAAMIFMRELTAARQALGFEEDHRIAQAFLEAGGGK